ncbi:aminoglycoside adenylyltransferase domain-containing protein [Azospirillum halopraeferens]|uniref:aminoglycoside adenylyltransferase domain-containing protein n=1 Tax=Azospirillum halopraeferens TaxID=34010 RepID=UPI0004280102|nr:aminoglycoside adenylyltransferase domain-containing protein [Azospirillum halopraeferens]
MARIARELFGTSLAAVCLHGSAASGHLRPQSDVDVLVVIDRAMTAGERQRLLAALLRRSGRHPARRGGPRCIEVMVFLTSRLTAPAYPACCEFVYGEWLRGAFEAGAVPEPACDPEHTLVLAQARRQAVAIVGPDPAAVLPPIPDGDVRRAMRDALPALLGCLAGDERNGLLTLARMWRTAATGEFVTKDAAADRAIPRLPADVAGVLALARDGYLGRVDDDWTTRRTQARHAAEHLVRQVTTLL